MSNRSDKPKKSSAELVADMRDNRGITFKYTNETEAEKYLDDVNNYMRTAAFRYNYEKYQMGENKGKYMALDFAYLQELSTIDMHYRFLVEKMCSDIEHGMCVKLIKDIQLDETTDGYDIVNQFLSENSSVIRSIENTIASPHTGKLIRKYFTVNETIQSNGKSHNEIVAYDDCPVWVLVELMTFGSLSRFYEFYYSSRKEDRIPRSIVQMATSLRNAAAHNNCILYDLHPGVSSAQGRLPRFVKKKAAGLTASQRSTRLSSRPLLEWVALIYMYDAIVVGDVRIHRIEEIRKLFEVRMLEKREYFTKNQLIVQSYRFAYEVVKAVLF